MTVAKFINQSGFNRGDNYPSRIQLRAKCLSLNVPSSKQVDIFAYFLYDQLAPKKIIFDPKLLTEIHVEDIDPKDYPDFVDAYVESAMYDGVEMDEKELDQLNDLYPEIAQENALEQLI